MNKLIVFSVVCVVASSLWSVSIPQSPVVTYGLIRDEYGVPLKSASEAEVRLVKAAASTGTVYSRSAVTDQMLPGVNYRLSLEIDSEGPSRSYAVLSGTEMKILCTVGGEEAYLSPVSVFVTPKAGTAQRKDYTIGTDADRDGMPDAWEEWVLRCAGKSYDSAAVTAFDPKADADSDGMTNFAEFLAGTDPFLETEMFAITAFESVADTDLVMIRFMTRSNRKYHVIFSESLGEDAVWAPVPTSKKLGVQGDYEKYDGTGRVLTIYAPRSVKGVSGFFRVVCN
ncbi:MAG: hypothetical protein J6Q84_00540 [Kiritimatiellae bacterium]|nr:hypothetical protein [Kiritimatiellia bacterium]